MCALVGSALEKAFKKGMRDKKLAASFHERGDRKKAFHYLVHALRRFSEVLMSIDECCPNYPELCESRAWSLRILEQLYPEESWKHINSKRIAMDSTGYGFEEIFRPVLNNNVIHIDYHDKQVKPTLFSGKGGPISKDLKRDDGHCDSGFQTDNIVVRQMEYFTQFCELVVQQAPNCRKISVHTEFCKENFMQQYQNDVFKTLQKSLKLFGISLEYELIPRKDQLTKEIRVERAETTQGIYIKAEALEKLKCDLDKLGVSFDIEVGQQFCPNCMEAVERKNDDLVQIQEEVYNTLRRTLEKKGVIFAWGSTSRNDCAQHNREFIFREQHKTTRILCDWGLDVYQNPASAFEIGAYSLGLRRCKQTDVSYYVQTTPPSTAPLLTPGELICMPTARIVFNAPLDERNRASTLQLSNPTDVTIAWTINPTKKGNISVYKKEGTLDPKTSVFLGVSTADNLYETGERLQLKWTNMPTGVTRFSHDLFNDEAVVKRKFIRIEYNA